MNLSRKTVATVVAEFLGTGLLTVAILSVSKSTIGIPYFISIIAGVAVATASLLFARVSGGHFNPAITLGLWSIRRVQTLTAIVYIAAQLLGGVGAYFLFTYFVGQTWHNVGTFEGRILVAEAVGGFIFSLAWAVALYHRLETAKAATVIGLGLILGVLVSSAGAGGIVNPAVALGVRSWVWGTYVLGPVLGAVIGFNLYSLLFAPSVELVAAEEALLADKPVKATIKSSKKK
ncbi:MAG TPA: aquaporin [Candidatus Saccharimonadales bacterium]